MLDVYLYCVGYHSHRGVNPQFERYSNILVSPDVSTWSFLAGSYSVDQGLSNGMPHELIVMFLTRL
jgi:hypothetical protein